MRIMILVLNASYSYNYKIEVAIDDGEWTTVADATQGNEQKVYLRSWEFTATQCNRIRLTAYPYNSHPTNDVLWIREMLIYETKNKA